MLAELASGDTTRLAIASTGSALLAPVLVPLAAAAGAIALGCVVFSRRDFRA